MRKVKTNSQTRFKYQKQNITGIRHNIAFDGIYFSKLSFQA